METTTRKRHIGRYILCVLLCTIIIGAVFYEVKFLREPDLSNVEIGNFADNHQRTVGDYVVICEENGLRTFPFVNGGTMSFLSLPDGKKYGIMDNKSFLKGFGNPIVVNGSIYYGEAWDGSTGGDLHKKGIGEKESKFLEYIYEEPFYIMENHVYYRESYNDDYDGLFRLKVLDESTLETKTVIEEPITNFILDENYVYYYVQSQGQLYKFNLEKETKEDLTWHVGNQDILDIMMDQSSNILLQTGEKGIIMCDGDTGEVKNIVENGNMKENTLYFVTSLMHLKWQNLYYIDEGWNLYCKNLNTGKTRRILESSDINFLGLSEEDFKSPAIVIGWCDNYIALQVSCNTEDEEWKCGIIAFDYEGNEVYRKDKMRLDL